MTVPRGRSPTDTWRVIATLTEKGWRWGSFCEDSGPNVSVTVLAFQTPQAWSRGQGHRVFTGFQALSRQ